MNNSAVTRIGILILMGAVAAFLRYKNAAPSVTDTPVDSRVDDALRHLPHPDGPVTMPLPRFDTPKEEAPRDRPPVTDKAEQSAPKHDLEHDEKMGGHTLRKHVGRTDEQLRERMEQEHISAASTFNDKEAAEISVAAALKEHAGKIEKWLKTPDHDGKFAFDYAGDPSRTVGRSLKRGASSTRPCHGIKLVLASRGESYFVLTAYPEL
jgi:hypothetical protein